MVKRVKVREDDSQLVYSNKSGASYSRFFSSISNQNKSKRKISHQKLQERRIIKKDLGIETDLCIMRRHFKKLLQRKKANANSRSTAKTAKSRFSNYTNTEDVIKEQRDESACGDSITDYTTRTQTSNKEELVYQNLESLVQNWVQKILNEEEIKNMVQDAFDTVVQKMGLQKSKTFPHNVLADKESINKQRNSMVRLRARSKINVSQTSNTVLPSTYTVPIIYKTMRLISTLSIPRNLPLSLSQTFQKQKKNTAYRIRKKHHKKMLLSLIPAERGNKTDSVNSLKTSTKSWLENTSNLDEPMKRISVQDSSYIVLRSILKGKKNTSQKIGTHKATKPKSNNPFTPTPVALGRVSIKTQYEPLKPIVNSIGVMVNVQNPEKVGKKNKSVAVTRRVPSFEVQRPKSELKSTGTNYNFKEFVLKHSRAANVSIATEDSNIDDDDRTHRTIQTKDVVHQSIGCNALVNEYQQTPIMFRKTNIGSLVILQEPNGQTRVSPDDIPLDSKSVQYSPTDVSRELHKVKPLQKDVEICCHKSANKNRKHIIKKSASFIRQMAINKLKKVKSHPSLILEKNKDVFHQLKNICQYLVDINRSNMKLGIHINVNPKDDVSKSNIDIPSKGAEDPFDERPQLYRVMPLNCNIPDKPSKRKLVHIIDKPCEQTSVVCQALNTSTQPRFLNPAIPKVTSNKLQIAKYTENTLITPPITKNVQTEVTDKISDLSFDPINSQTLEVGNNTPKSVKRHAKHQVFIPTPKLLDAEVSTLKKEKKNTMNQVVLLNYLDAGTSTLKGSSNKKGDVKCQSAMIKQIELYTVTAQTSERGCADFSVQVEDPMSENVEKPTATKNACTQWSKYGVMDTIESVGDQPNIRDIHDIQNSKITIQMQEIKSTLKSVSNLLYEYYTMHQKELNEIYKLRIEKRTQPLKILSKTNLERLESLKKCLINLETNKKKSETVNKNLMQKSVKLETESKVVSSKSISCSGFKITKRPKKSTSPKKSAVPKKMQSPRKPSTPNERRNMESEAKTLSTSSFEIRNQLPKLPSYRVIDSESVIKLTDMTEMHSSICYVNNLHKPSSYRVIESESVIEVTNMQSQKSKLSAPVQKRCIALTCSLPEESTLYEVSHHRQKKSFRTDNTKEKVNLGQTLKSGVFRYSGYNQSVQDFLNSDSSKKIGPMCTSNKTDVESGKTHESSTKNAKKEHPKQSCHLTPNISPEKAIQDGNLFNFNNSQPTRYVTIEKEVSKPLRRCSQIIRISNVLKHFFIGLGVLSLLAIALIFIIQVDWRKAIDKFQKTDRPPPGTLISISNLDLRELGF